MKPDPLRDIWKADGRYAYEAFQFLLNSLEHTVEHTGRLEEEQAGRHVSGQELLDGMRGHALNLYGPLAAEVWRSWGVRSSLDWGHIVFALVQGGMLNRQDSDTLDDFENGYDFDEVFVKSYQPRLPSEIPPTPTSGDE